MIWVIGSEGMLGKQVCYELSKNGIDFYKSDKEVDITNPKELSRFVENKNVSWIINCSAYTAVDKAETEELKAYKINAEGVGNIARISESIGAKLIHISTDYVFDGDKNTPYTEEDGPEPASVYGKTKLEGENLLKKETKRFFIIRISWLYGVFGNNFVKTMVRLFKEKNEVKVVADQKGSPTYAGLLAYNLFKLVQSDSVEYGIYLYSDEGEISWYDFAVKIGIYSRKYGLVNKNFVYKKEEYGDVENQLLLLPINTDEYPTPAKRPAYSVMDKTKIKNKLKFKVNDWEDNLGTFFSEWKNYNFY